MKEERPIVGYECNQCSFSTGRAGGLRNNKFKIEEHLMLEHGIAIVVAKHITCILAKPAKKWQCPRCGEKMGYHLKHHHQQNATRSGEDYMCIKTP